MKKMAATIMVFLQIGLLCACGSDNRASPNMKIRNTGTMEASNDESSPSAVPNDMTVKVRNNKIDEKNKVALDINSAADFSVIYKNVEELIHADPPYIIFGEITDLNYTNLEHGIYTNLSVTVYESLKGDLNVNDVISVFENGGITTYKDYVEHFGDELETKEWAPDTGQPADDELVVSHFDGTEFSKKGQKVMLFLAESEGDIIPKGAYECIGAYMGKLTLENDQFVRTKSANNEDSFYIDQESELKKSNVLSKVKNSEKLRN